MAAFKDFVENIPAKRLKVMAIAALIAAVIVSVSLMYYFTLSGDPVNMMASQLSFSDAFLRAEYSMIANVDAFKIAQGLDYGFMASYALLIFFPCNCLPRGRQLP